MYREFLRKFDWLLFGAVFLLVVLSLATIYSVALSQEQQDFLFFKKQLLFAGVGFCLMFFLTIISYTTYRSSSIIFYFFSILLLVLVLFFGQTIHGTTGWFSFGFFNFQPVEFAKLAIIFIFARFFSKKLDMKRNKKLLFESALFLVLPVVLVILQPDFGSALIFVCLCAGLIIALGVKRLHLVVAIVLLVAISFLSWGFILKDYHKERILTFIDSSRDPWGSGYNIRQAIIAIGSGQLFGRGLGFGAQSQLKFLPESQTDFIFAVIAEELGFFTILFVLACYAIIFYRGFKIGFGSRDNFAFLLSLGITFLIFIETVINISMNLGLFPVAGITLPFLSYGGSSFLTHIAMIGILQSIAVRR